MLDFLFVNVDRHIAKTHVVGKIEIN